MSKWYVSVGMSLSIDYDDIEADTKEEAEKIAKRHCMKHQKSSKMKEKSKMQ